jgi:large subunit ribosomal protein L22
MSAQATVENLSISPKKLKRLVDVVRGRHVEEARAILNSLPTPAAQEIAKVLKSAVANAENNLMLSPANLKIVTIFANKAVTLKRMRAMTRGRASRIFKHHSHVTIVVDERGN